MASQWRTQTPTAHSVHRCECSCGCLTNTSGWDPLALTLWAISKCQTCTTFSSIECAAHVSFVCCSHIALTPRSITSKALSINVLCMCVQMLASVSLGDQLNSTLDTCGRLWISTNGGTTLNATQHYTYKVLHWQQRLLLSHWVQELLQPVVKQ